MRDEKINEFYLPLTCTLVLECKQEMLHVPVGFDNNPTIDALVDIGDYINAVAQNDLETIKRKAPNNIVKIDNTPKFQIQVANGWLEKPLATATLKIEIGDNTFGEHFVVRMKLTQPIIGLHFLKRDSIVLDTTHGLIHFPHLTMLVNTTTELSAKPQTVLADDPLTIPTRLTKTVTAFVDHPSEWNTTATVTPVGKVAETVGLLVSHSMSTMKDGQVAVRVTNTTETHNLIKTNGQNAEFSVVTRESS